MRAAFILRSIRRRDTAAVDWFGRRRDVLSTRAVVGYEARHPDDGLTAQLARHESRPVTKLFHRED